MGGRSPRDSKYHRGILRLRRRTRPTPSTTPPSSSRLWRRCGRTSNCHAGGPVRRSTVGPDAPCPRRSGCCTDITRNCARHTANDLVARHAVLVVEDLDSKNMTKSAKGTWNNREGTWRRSPASTGPWRKLYRGTMPGACRSRLRAPNEARGPGHSTPHTLRSRAPVASSTPRRA